MRRVIVVAAFVFAGSCGGTPTVPSTPPPAGGGGLPAGAYTLTLNDTAVFACENGICTSLLLCIGPSSAQPPTASIPVTLSRDGDRATLVPVASGESLRATLQVGGSSVTGTISGTATTPTGASVTASGSIAGVVNTLPALPNLPSGSGVVGMMDGQLSVAGTSCSNPTHHFSLGPR